MRVEALETSAADVAYSDWQELDSGQAGGEIKGKVVARRIEDIDDDPEIAVFTDFWAPPAALLYRRDIVDKIGGWNESLPIIQDARFLLDAARHGAKFVHVPGVGAYYRVHRDMSLSRRDPAAFVRDVYDNASDIEAHWSTHGGLTDTRRHALARVYSYTARGFFLNDSTMFKQNIRRLYQVEPGFRLTWPKVASLARHFLGQKATAALLSRMGRPPMRPGRPTTGMDPSS